MWERSEGLTQSLISRINTQMSSGKFAVDLVYAAVSSC